MTDTTNSSDVPEDLTFVAPDLDQDSPGPVDDEFEDDLDRGGEAATGDDEDDEESDEDESEEDESDEEESDDDEDDEEESDEGEKAEQAHYAVA